MQGEGTGAYLKNRDQFVNVGVIGHASAEDTKVFYGGSGRGQLPRKILKFLILKLLEMH